MQHLDSEELSLLALFGLGEDSMSSDHLLACPDCAAEYAALRRAVDAVRPAQGTGDLEAPHPQVWAGIHSRLELPDSLRGDPLGVEASTPADPVAQSDPLPKVSSARVIPLTASSRWRTPAAWVGAAAASILIAVGAVWAFNPAPQQLANTELSPLGQFSATGSAEVVETRDGIRHLQVKLSEDQAQGYQEVWLIAPDLSRLVSLGVMDSETGTFDVPAGLELSEFPIVDVSDEPLDGNPTHSSNSIARGILAF